MLSSLDVTFVLESDARQYSLPGALTKSDKLGSLDIHNIQDQE